MRTQLWTVVEYLVRALVGAVVLLFILAHVVPERLLPWNQGKSESWWLNRARSKASARDFDSQYDGARGR